MYYGENILEYAKQNAIFAASQILLIMTKLKIIGREYEQAIIRNYLESDKAELIAVYGRRRVGKTYLVKSIFDNEFEHRFFIRC